MQELVVALLRPARRDLEVDEHRALLGQDSADLLVEYALVDEGMHAAIAGGAGEAGEVDAVAVGDRVSARLPRFISRLPSPSSTITRRSGLPRASPSPCEEASPIAPCAR